MPDLRRDPITGRWVIIAPQRAERPHDFQAAPQWRHGGDCPFCEGHEVATPGEVFAFRELSTPPDGPGWRVRVVPNKYPALSAGSELEYRKEGIYEVASGIGAHEVIVETPRHVTSLSDLSRTEVVEVLATYRRRLLDLKSDPRLVYGMLFKNVGAAAGASIEHTHSQLIGLPIVPISVWEEMTGALEYYHRRGQCVYCAMIGQETASGARIAIDSSCFMAFCPFASRFPGELWIVPKRHCSHYENIDDRELDDLAVVLRSAIGKLDAALDRPAYNLIVHTTPFDINAVVHYHWHIEVMPSLTRTAGFEWGTGFYINPVPPERAAAILRQTRNEASA